MLQDLISGDTRNYFHIPALRYVEYKQVARSFESSLWMLPPAQLYDDILVELQTPGNGDSSSPTIRSYTAHDYAELFSDAGSDLFDFMWQLVQHLTAFDEETQQLADPGVAVHPIYSTGIETVTKYIYHGTFDSEPTAVADWAGDGTIQLKGLQAGNHWNQTKVQLELVNTTHVGVCSHPDALDYIRQIIGAPGSKRGAIRKRVSTAK